MWHTQAHTHTYISKKQKQIFKKLKTNTQFIFLAISALRLNADNSLLHPQQDLNIKYTNSLKKKLLHFQSFI